MKKIVTEVIACITVATIFIGIVLSVLMAVEYKSYMRGRFEGKEEPTLESVGWRIETGEIELYHDDGSIVAFKFG